MDRGGGQNPLGQVSKISGVKIWWNEEETQPIFEHYLQEILSQINKLIDYIICNVHLKFYNQKVIIIQAKIQIFYSSK